MCRMRYLPGNRVMLECFGHGDKVEYRTEPYASDVIWDDAPKRTLDEAIDLIWDDLTSGPGVVDLDEEAP